MYALIKKLYNFFTYKKQIPEKNNTFTDIEPTDIKINISANIESEKIFCKIDTDIEDIMTNDSSITKCEKIAYFLSIICENNKYVSELIFHNIQEQKKISDKHLLFYDNVSFFLKQYLSLKKNISSYNNDPLIKPSKAFKTYIMEEKI